jgi:hypothetical protein
MTKLPVEQLGKGQRLAAKLHIEPEAKVMQGDFRRQASLKASEVVRPFASQAEGIEQFVVNGFDHLSQPSQPASPGFGPRLLAALMRSSNDFRPVALAPLGMWLLSGEAFISEIAPWAWRPILSRAAVGRARAAKKVSASS